MIHTKIIKINKTTLVTWQKFLDDVCKDGRDTEETFTAKFGDMGEGDIEVDIKICSGDVGKTNNFIDAVMFQDGSEAGCLDIKDTLVGEYIFQGYLKDTYKVIIEEMPN